MSCTCPVYGLTCCQCDQSFRPGPARLPGVGPARLCTEDGTLNEREEMEQGLQAARERDATVRAPVLRIGVSLDLDTVGRPSTAPAR